MALTKGFARNSAKAPLDQRLADMSMIVCNADGSPRVGVLGNANTAIVTTTATMAVTIAAAEFVTSKGKADGVMIYTNDGSVDVLIGAAPATNSRVDVIWTRHEDNTTGDAASLPIFGVTAGVALASPTKPAIPTGALELATLRIYSGTTATNGGANVLTNTYQMTAPRGGVVPFRTKTELDAWTNAINGQEAHVAGVVYRRDVAAGAWMSNLRLKHLSVATGTIATGTVLGTLSIPRRDFAQRVVVDISGYIAPVGAAGNCGINLTVSAGGVAVANPSIVATVPNGAIGAYARMGIFDISAGAGADVVISLVLTVATTATTAQVGILATATILSAGQF